MESSYTIRHVPLDNVYMAEAKRVAHDQPVSKQPYQVGSVVVKNDRIIGFANNYNPYHEEQGCERRKLNTPSGQDYHLCPGCDPQTHSEPRAIQNALDNGFDVTDAEIYMYGHYHACQNCVRAMRDNRIAHYYVVDQAETLFASPVV